MTIRDAQHDLSRAYVGGGPGVLTSSLVWFLATFIQYAHGIGAAFAALFFGGMLIFPVSKLLCRFIFGREGESTGNPLGITALESTMPMIGGLIAAWLFLPLKPALVFPLAAIAVGTRYAVFKTCYGDRSFWLLAAAITLIRLGSIFVPSLHGSTTLLVAIVELLFGLVLTIRATRAVKTSA